MLIHQPWGALFASRAIEIARGQPGDTLDNAVGEQVRRSVVQLIWAAPVLADAVKAGRLQIVGASYDLETSRVEVVK